MYEEIMDNLEEGIILFKENTTQFKNRVFTDLLDRLIIDRKNYKDGRPVDEQIMILKFLKIYNIIVQ